MPARNDHGSVTALTPGGTADLVSIVADTKKLRGFFVSGDGSDAVAWVEVDGTPLPGVRAYMNVAKHARVVLPSAEPYASEFSVVVLRVRNTGGAAADFEGVLLGE